MDVTPQPKVVLLGPASVGKTSIIMREIEDSFDPDCQSTIGASFSRKDIILENSTITLQLWDTAGQERFKSLTPMYYRGAKVIILVFDLTDKSTLEEAEEWAEEVSNQGDCLPPLIYLVGNKNDLDKERQVDANEVFEIATEMGAKYYEVSAKTGLGIESLFFDIGDTLNKIIQKDNEKKKSVELVLDDTPKEKSCCKN